jgi:hypothetical protein
MAYWIWLLGFSLAFMLLERLWPRRSEQSLFRRGITNDILYVFLNGHFLGLIMSYVTIHFETVFINLTHKAGMNLQLHLVQNWPGFYSS